MRFNKRLHGDRNGMLADYRQTQSLLQVAINSRLNGQDADALPLFEVVQKRFKRLGMTMDAGIAGAWVNALKLDNCTPV